MVHRLTVSYVGTRYAGWQRQPDAPTVQAVLEEVLGSLVGQPVRVVGAGRTDAGVHARGQVAHLTRPRRTTPGAPKVPPRRPRTPPAPLEIALPPKAIVHAANRRLPEDVRIHAAHRVPAGFDARRAAVGKEYRYRLYNGAVPPAPDAPFVGIVKQPLDLDALRRATGLLPGRRDWSAFAAAGGNPSHPVRRLWGASVDLRGRELEFRFVGQGFLRGMVRALVGSVVEVGRGRFDLDWLASLLEGGRREDAGPSAPARGLVLERVFYPSRWEPIDGYEA